MKTAPRPWVTTHPYPENDDHLVVRFEWDFFAIEMFEDEARIMARTILDALEEADR